MSRYPKYIQTALALCAIFCLALCIRLVFLSKLPANFHEDEVLVGYVGRFILHNGVDLYGNSWPLWYFDKFGDFYIIGPFYLSGLSTFLFGINEFAVRFPTALIGSLGTIALYGLVQELFNNKKVALLSALFLALLPWHIVLSRSSSEGVMGATFCLTATYLVLRAIRQHAYHFLLTGLVCYLLSYWIYHPYRIYTPVFLVLIFTFFNRMIQSFRFKVVFVSAIIFFSCLTIWIMTTPWGKGRLQQTSILSDGSGVTLRNIELIHDTGSNSPILARALHNKVTGFGREFVRQYFGYLSPLYLFVDGWGEKFMVREQGMFYFSYLIFLIGCVAFVSGDIHSRSIQNGFKYFIVILAFSLVPPSMTYIGSPNMNRSMMFGVLLIPLIAYGAMLIWSTHKRMFLVLLFTLCVESVYFGLNYALHFDSANSIPRRDATKPLILAIQKYKNKQVYLPREGTKAIYYLFFNQNFDKYLAGKFKFDAQIPQVDNVHFLPESNCLNTGKQIKDAGIHQGDIIVFNETCRKRPEDDVNIRHLETIKQVNELLGYEMYEYLGPEKNKDVNLR